ncbi:MAG: hypothetical protein R3F55_03435 [Alphaproteobacteria bacterium]
MAEMLPPATTELAGVGLAVVNVTAPLAVENEMPSTVAMVNPVLSTASDHAADIERQIADRPSQARRWSPPAPTRPVAVTSAPEGCHPRRRRRWPATVGPPAPELRAALMLIVAAVCVAEAQHVGGDAVDVGLDQAQAVRVQRPQVDRPAGGERQQRHRAGAGIDQRIEGGAGGRSAQGVGLDGDGAAGGDRSSRRRCGRSPARRRRRRGRSVTSPPLRCQWIADADVVGGIEDDVAAAGVEDLAGDLTIAEAGLAIDILPASRIS